MAPLPAPGAVCLCRLARQRGLAINDPSQRHTLNRYGGGSTVSALQAACIYYVGVQLLLPGQDPGLDLDQEYGLALGLAAEG